MPHQLQTDDLAAKHPPVEVASSGTEAADSLGFDPERCGREYGVREGTGTGGEDSRDTRPDRATRFIETARGFLSYAELAPYLSDRVTAVEAALLKGAFVDSPLNESLLLDLHHRIAGDLVPDWAGRWRDVEVVVGRLLPPPPYQIALLMRDYVRDLNARWNALSEREELLLELLAFAEGRFLSIHPFRDFNGRTIRVFLIELLRRLDLPRVELAPQTESGRVEYFAALEAADRRDWYPLTDIWKVRLTNAQSH